MLRATAADDTVLDILPDLPQPKEADSETIVPAAAAVPQIVREKHKTETYPTEKMEQDTPQEAEPVQESMHALSALPQEEQAPEQITMAPPAAQPLRLVGEVFKTYIITERDGELCLIDKHAAHERILF